MAVFHAAGDEVDAQADECGGGADVAGARPAIPCGNRHPAKPRPQRVRQVECRVVGRRRQAWGFVGDVHQADLQRRGHGNHGADQADAQQYAPQRTGGEGEEDQHGHRPHHNPAHGAKLHAVEQFAAGDVADDAAHAKRGEAEGDPLGRDFGHFEHGRGEVAEHAEHAGKANRANRQRHPHLRFGEGAQFFARVAAWFVAAIRDELPDEEEGAQGDGADQGERRAPAQVLAQEGGDGVAEQHGQG